MTGPWCVIGKCCNALWGDPCFLCGQFQRNALYLDLHCMHLLVLRYDGKDGTGVQNYNSSMDWCSFSCLLNRKFGLQTKLITWMLWWCEKTYNLVSLFVEYMSLCLGHLFYVVFDCVIMHVFMTVFHVSPFSVYSSVHG